MKGGGYLQMGCKSKYIKSQIDYGMYKSKNSRRKGTHIIRNKQKRELNKEIKEYILTK